MVRRQDAQADEAAERALADARAGSPRGFEALFRLHAPSVLGFARARGVEDPDGVTNEVFLGAYQALGRFEGGAAAFRGWLFTIARNKVADALRRQSRRPQTSALERDLERPGRHLEDEVLDDLGTAWVLEALATLTPDQRDVLLLRVVSQLTVVEVAAVLGKPEGAIKALQRRGLRRIGREIGDRGVPL